MKQYALDRSSGRIGLALAESQRSPTVSAGGSYSPNRPGRLGRVIVLIWQRVSAVGANLLAVAFSLAMFERIGVHGRPFDKKTVREITGVIWRGVAPEGKRKRERTEEDREAFNVV